uniref:Uncharacterized protein n=1 Tax=Lolium perenne TaxID=4522 RepID=B2RGE6_LOLPR|nr:hypothetical protein [Lolium perenne]
MRNITQFLNRFYLELNDVFSANCDDYDSLERVMVPKPIPNNETENDQDSASNDGRGQTNIDNNSTIIEGCEKIEGCANSKVSSTLIKIPRREEHKSFTFPILKMLYVGGGKQYITHRNMPHMDYYHPVEIKETASRLEFYTLFNKKPFFARNFGKVKSIFESLGLLAIRKGFDCMTIKHILMEKTHLGAGVKNLFHNEIYYKTLEVTTIFYNPVLASYVYCSFVSVIQTGVACTVWYKLIPCGTDPMIFPDEIRSITIEKFTQESPVVEGYQHITYLLTNDIQDTVLDLFRNDETFTSIVNINEYNQELLQEEKHQKCMAGYCTAILICMYITFQLVNSGGGLVEVDNLSLLCWANQWLPFLLT